jgi:hypothetical protein
MHLEEASYAEVFSSAVFLMDAIGAGSAFIPCPLAHITTDRVFRAINKASRIWGDGMTPKVLWEVVKDAAARSGIEKIAPHDLRRTCARLCRWR